MFLIALALRLNSGDQQISTAKAGIEIQADTIIKDRVGI